MPKKTKRPLSEAQKAHLEKLHAARQAKADGMKQIPTFEQAPISPQAIPMDSAPEVGIDPSVDDLKRQIDEMRQNQELMMLALRGSAGNDSNNSSGATLGSTGRLLGEVEKYALNPDLYPDPTTRLSQEARLRPLAFDYNYELEYEVTTVRYETKTGANFSEPKFMITLNRVKLDDEGNQTDQRYIARKMVFHEDPEAAMVIARQNGVDLDHWAGLEDTGKNRTAFLNEMRYLRVRDWLFDIFWPRPVDDRAKIREESINGQIIQVFTKSSVNPSEVDFGKIDTKLQV